MDFPPYLWGPVNDHWWTLNQIGEPNRDVFDLCGWRKYQATQEPLSYVPYRWPTSGAANFDRYVTSEVPGLAQRNRLYFWTCHPERENLNAGNRKYHFDGTAFIVLTDPTIPGVVPLYRFFDTGTRGEHVYSKNPTVPPGFVFEGPQAYVFPSADAGPAGVQLVPVHHFYRVSGI